MINQRTGRFSSGLFQNVRNFSDVIETSGRPLIRHGSFGKVPRRN